MIHSEVRTLAAGGDAHTLVVRAGDTAWSAGANASGQLGDGGTLDRSTPGVISGLTGVRSVAAGASHSVAVTAAGNLYAWGANDAGQLGDNTTVQRLSPVELSLTDVVAIAAGDRHSVAMTRDGRVFTWGSNASGQLGNGTTSDSLVPVQITTDAVSIAAGGSFTLVVKANGSVWGTGDNEFGALGDGTNTSRTSLTQMTAFSTAIAASAGEKHSLILLSNGAVYATGRNHAGQLGFSGNDRSQPWLVSVSNIVGIAAGDDFSLALDKDGVVWSWGDNAYGQLGVATPSSRSTPLAIAGLSGVTYVAAGANFSIAINANRMVATFGRNGVGQLGDGTTDDRSTPAASDGFSERVATPTFSVAAGTYANTFNVTISNATAGSTLRYTQNGSEPTESDPTITSGASIAIEQSQTLKVKAWKSGWVASAVGAAAYELKVAAPTLSPAGGTFTSPASVTLQTPTAGAVVRYTMDGSTPTAASPEYTGPITVNTATTLRAAAFKANWSPSHEAGGTYTMNFGTLSAPVLEPATGTYVGGATVTMSASQSGAVIRFTTTGETPTASSAAYTSPLAVDGAMTVKAKAFHPDYTESAETSRAYTIAAAAPTIAPTTGTYTSAQTVTMTPPSGPAVTIRYTVDGSEPTELSAAYSAAFTVETGTTITARSFPSNGWVASSIASTVVSFNYGTLPAPDVSPAGGVYAEAQAVSLSATSGATIRYTVDGSEPTAVSNLYVAPFAVGSGTVAVKARAFHVDWTQSAVMRADYTIDSAAPTITSTRFPAAIDGWHNTATTIAFSCQDNVGIASCSAPIMAATEGAGQQIAGSAIDRAGREATET